VANSNVKKIWASGKAVVNAWLAIPSGFSAEVIAQCGFDSVTVDMQHGVQDYLSMVQCFQAMNGHPVTPMVRVPWNEPGIIGKVLDAGAMGVICPMINSRAEAEAFVGAGRYPPAGYRSFGPNRVVQYAGADYAAHANAEVLLFAMIETRAGLAALDDILDVPGLDGIYVGPGDLSLALGEQPSMAPTATVVVDAMARILARTLAKGRIAAVHTDGAATAGQRFREGFQLCTLQNDTRLLINAASAQVRATRTAVDGP